MEQYVIKGGNPLVGEVEIAGAKNAALAILAAAIMTDETILIENLPDVRDINVLLEAIAGIGAQVDRIDKSTVKINGSTIGDVSVDYEYIKKIRASYYLLGALLGKYKHAEVPLPGGCNIGSRPIDQHLKGFRALGADVDIMHGAIVAKADELHGSHIFLDVVSVGATINIMMAASLAPGRTILENAAREPSFNTWLKPLTVYEVVDNVVTIIVPSEQVGLNYISKKYKLPLQVTISEVTGMENCDINFILPEDVPKKEEVSPKAQSQDARCEEAHLNPKYTFDTFVVGSNNKFAQAAALAVAESPGDTYNPLFIYGGAGLGKTHLMHSIAHFIIDHDENSKVLYVTSEEFTNELIETIRNGNNSAMTKFREKYRNIDVLLVDDIQFIIGKESTQEEFFHTFNSLHSAKKQIIISSDKPPKDMEILEERFRSRFEWGLIADITLPDYETRMAILHKKEEMDGYDINEEVIKYIANNIKSNIRELEGAINKVMAFAKLEKKEVTLELAEQALKDIISPDEKKVITPDYIISMVAEHFDVTVDDLCGNKRNSKIVTPRQIAMYLCREIISTPLKSIGKCLGNRDHTTIMHGIDKIEKEINNDENLKNTIETLKKKINPQG